jgi:UDP-glucose 4-epimerase
MNILVTGATGYIGSHTIVELISNGHTVIGVDNFSNSKRQVLDRIRKITGKKIAFHNIDVRNKTALSRVFAKYSIDSVIHFAGLKAVGESVNQPLRYYENNLFSTIVLCQVMSAYNVKQLVFSSSATVYASPSPTAITENMPLSATNPYGMTKLMAEQILESLVASDTQWRVTLLRYFNPIGAHSSGLIGEDPNDIPNNLFPYISQVAIGRRKRLAIFGNDYSTKDGTGVRDYIHVTDLAKGHLKALEHPPAAGKVVAYNLGTGVGYSVLEAVSAFEKASGRRVPYDFADRRPGDIGVCFADPSKAEHELNWTASKTLTEMCADAWRWQYNNPNGYVTPIPQPQAVHVNAPAKAAKSLVGSRASQ